MKRALSALMLMAGLLVLSAVAATAQGPVRSETLYAGPYRLRVDFYSDPAFAGRRFDFDVLVSADKPQDVQGITLTATAVPDVSTNSTEQANLIPVGSTPGGFKGFVTMPVRGRWTLRFFVRGSLATNPAGTQLQVAAPPVIPIELAWAIALSPLLLLGGFLVEQRAYLRRLQAAPGG